MEERSRRRPLNSQDRLTLVADRLRRAGRGSGMLGQYQMWFDGPVDESAVTAAAAELARIHPIATARLQGYGTPEGAEWRFPTAERVPLIVETCAGDDQAAFDRARREFAEPLDPETMPPLRLVLLRRSEGGDVLIVHFTHVLMDGNAPALMLEDLVRSEEERPARVRDAGERDEIARWLEERPDAGRAVPMGRGSRPLESGEAVVLASRDRSSRDARHDLGAAFATVAPGDLAALRERVRAVVGFENVTPALVASGFRAAARVSPGGEPDDVFRTSVPISLRPSRPDGASIFCNLTAQLLLEARRDEIDDRDGLVRVLARRMRAQLRDGADVQSTRRTRWLGERAGPLVEGMMKRFWSRAATFRFAYFGRPPEALRRMFGARVVAVRSINAAGRTPQFSLHEADGLQVILSYDRTSLPDAAAGALLDGFVADLTGP